MLPLRSKHVISTCISSNKHVCILLSSHGRPCELLSSLCVHRRCGRCTIGPIWTELDSENPPVDPMNVYFWDPMAVQLPYDYFHDGP